MPRDARASDAERELVVTRLSDACAEGRLTADELGDRVAAAYAARTYAELDSLTADLPRGAAVPRRPAAPGARTFTERVVSPAPREHVAAQVLARLGPLLDARGYSLASHDPAAIVFERERRPRWTIAVAVFVFPLGLIALTHKERRRIVVTLAPVAGGGTELTVYGRAPLGLRRAFAELQA